MEAAFIALVVAGLGLLGVIAGHTLNRLNALEDDLTASQAYNRVLWFYCRNLLDLYYLHRREGSPNPTPLPEEKQP